MTLDSIMKAQPQQLHLKLCSQARKAPASAAQRVVLTDMQCANSAVLLFVQHAME
jgi:hypothetical protein